MRPDLLMLFGDSIANGLGVREGRYGAQLAERLGCELVDLSWTARQAPESLSLLRESDAVPTYAVIAHGVTEAIVRPTRRSLRIVPGRWRRPGWMDPRPYYSRRRRRRALERAESELRWRVKNLLIRLDGGVQFTPLDEYVDAVRGLVDELHARGAAVVVLGPPELEGRYFPGSIEEQRRYAAAARAVVEEQGATWVPLAGRMDLWEHFFHDRFHPNLDGHTRIADLVEGAVGRDARSDLDPV
ncbi:SGNH/GDSL hydrolase family protein [Demequina subtropica]|uniref:SGNH/GDSL hydrolase family protein n=1 Tax=Demequina subtropica TaxID=1638989 RepID=UPI0014702994|nr:GDSL-type esterase/lipase family protein [Demequina subtropica]